MLTLPLTFRPPKLAPNTTINYNSGQPYLVQYNLTAEHQFPGDMALSVSYVAAAVSTS